MVARVPRWVLGVSLLVYAFLHVPILVLVVFSFNANRLVTVWGVGYRWEPAAVGAQ